MELRGGRLTTREVVLKRLDKLQNGEGELSSGENNLRGGGEESTRPLREKGEKEGGLHIVVQVRELEAE